ncbi:MAG: helix-turn-helix domain-containing protein [Polyangiales bacterium]
MPRTASDRDRKQKEKEILDVARKLFRDSGYEAASMSRIAERAGVAPNTIYWYFADKDALLIAVLNGVVAEALPEFAKRQAAPLDEQLAWLVEVFEGANNLIATVHARAAVSESVRTWHEQFHRMTEATLHTQLRSHGVPAKDLVHASQVAMFVIEGLLAHADSIPDRRGLMRWLVASLDRATAR